MYYDWLTYNGRNKPRKHFDTHNLKVSWTSIDTTGADGLYSIVCIVSVAVRVFMD